MHGETHLEASVRAQTPWLNSLGLRLAVMREYTDVIRPLVLVNMDKAKQNDERTRRPGLR